MNPAERQHEPGLQANFYKTGQGIAKNEAEAVRWYHTAAQEGNRNGIYEVYAKGDGGLSKNEEKARVWWECAVQVGHKAAALHLKSFGLEVDG